MVIKIGWIHSLPRGVTGRRCSLLPDYFWTLLLPAARSDLCPAAGVFLGSPPWNFCIVIFSVEILENPRGKFCTQSSIGRGVPGTIQGCGSWSTVCAPPSTIVVGTMVRVLRCIMGASARRLSLRRRRATRMWVVMSEISPLAYGVAISAVRMNKLLHLKNSKYYCAVYRYRELPCYQKTFSI